MLVSVITINYNNRVGLENTIVSVINQTAQLEFIIIDGGSTDGSADVINQYKDRITYWKSEKDRGIYHAMNKGVLASTGKYCIFMNSGDVFANSKVIEEFSISHDSIDIVCGNTFTTEWKQAPKEISLRYLYSNAICHQCAFIKRELLVSMPYDEKLKIVSDRKFFLQSLILNNNSYKSIDIDVVRYDINGYSAVNRFYSEYEYQQVLQELIPHRILLDYGRDEVGTLYGETAYDKLFVEIRSRNYRKLIYRISYAILKLISYIRESAKFIEYFPKKIQ